MYRKESGIALDLLYFTLWLVLKTRITLSKNQIQTSKQSRLGHSRFPTLQVICSFLLRVLIGSLWYFPYSDWLLWYLWFWSYDTQLKSVLYFTFSTYWWYIYILHIDEIFTSTQWEKHYPQVASTIQKHHIIRTKLTLRTVLRVIMLDAVKVINE